jgi:hypothetical protein
MVFYKVDTKLLFGKYNGKTLTEIIMINPLYINWCISNIKTFHLEPDVITQLKSFNASFFLTSDEENVLVNKYEEFSFTNFEVKLDFIYEHEKFQDIPNDIYSYCEGDVVLGECTEIVNSFTNYHAQNSNYEELSKHGYFDERGNYITNEESYNYQMNDLPDYDELRDVYEGNPVNYWNND